MTKPNDKTVRKFNCKYAEIQSAVGLVRDELEKSLALTKRLKLYAKSKALIKYGDDRCYTTEETRYLRPIPGIDNLCTKMDNLEWIMNIEQNLKDFIGDIEAMEVK